MRNIFVIFFLFTIISCEPNNETIIGGKLKDKENTEDICKNVSCSNHGNCELDNNQAKCICSNGYKESGLSCFDTNECLSNDNNCNSNPSCSNTDE